MTQQEQKRRHSKNHGTYQGTKMPTTGCPFCLDIFNQVQNTKGGYTPPKGPAKPAVHPLLETQPKVPEKTKTFVTIALDSSGSMQGIADSTRRELKRTLDNIKENAKKHDLEVLVSFRQFADSVYGYEFAKVDSNKLPTTIEYYPGGGTALLDAAGMSISDMVGEDNKTGNKHSFLLIVITDGEENGSYKYNAQTLPELMRKVQATDRFTLTFQLPKGFKQSFCRGYGIPEGNIAEWEASDEGITTATAQNCSAFSNYAVCRSKGVKATACYYTTDLSNVSKADLNALTPINSQAKVLQVPHETEIKSFVEKEMGFYRPGSAFYQLTKDEKVQPYKVVLIRDKATKKIYAGNEARQLIGLPAASSVGGIIKVKPGNHANFDVFVQSSSNNRKLVRGTTLIIWQ